MIILLNSTGTDLTSESILIRTIWLVKGNNSINVKELKSNREGLVCFVSERIYIYVSKEILSLAAAAASSSREGGQQQNSRRGDLGSDQDKLQSRRGRRTESR